MLILRLPTSEEGTFEPFITSQSQSLPANKSERKPADLAILNSLVNGAALVEHEISKAFAQKDDYLSDFDFTPIHVAVLDLYDLNDRERPSLEQYVLSLVIPTFELISLMSFKCCP